MSRAILAVITLSAIHAAPPAPGFPPAGVQVNSIQVDSSGDIYITGTQNQQVFVAKLDPVGPQVIYWTLIGGPTHPFDVGEAIAVGADGSAYVTGYTQSIDFPTTSGALQPTLPAPDATQPHAFAIKLDRVGRVQYATYLGGAASTRGNGISVDSSGNAYITGVVVKNFSAYPTTPGSIAGFLGDSGNQLGFGNAPQTGFILKLDPTGSTAPISILGFGGSQIALDPAGTIVAAGAPTGPTPTTPNAFQTSAPNITCATNLFSGPTPCNYQHVAKIDSSGKTLIFGTYVTGYWGATPSGMAFDADGNIVLAGVTNSPDFPVTPGAYQPRYLFQPSSSFEPNATIIPPAPAGFVAKLNSNGTALIWSTFFSGSGSDPSYTFLDGDTINGLVIDAAGNINISGTTKSADLPGLWSTLTPVSQRPTPSRDPTAIFVTRFTPDGVKLSATQLLQAVPNTPGSNALAMLPTGSLIIIPPLAQVRLSNPPRVASISDTDNTRLVRVAPGQLLTLWGTKLSPPGQPQPNGPFPTSWNGITVMFNGIAAPILYASGDQINLQVPFEIAKQTELTMQVAGALGEPPFSEPFMLGVIRRQPSVLVSGANFTGPLFGVAGCDPGVRCIQPLAINEDGSMNDRDHPAPAGSTATIFVNGIGLTSPALETGDVSTTVTALSPALGVPAVATETIPQSSTTLAQVRIRVPSTMIRSPAFIPLDVQDSQNAVPIRGVSALIWVTPQK